ncbi:hypothetical protein OC844_001023 [Tilletia horrida]|nr:hypothetical protein OC844_001023 [Tilletia horrida]
MEISITPATPAQDEAADVSFPAQEEEGEGEQQQQQQQQHAGAGDAQDGAGQLPATTSTGTIASAFSSSSTSSTDTAILPSSSSSAAAAAAAMTPIAISSRLSDIANAIEDIRGLLFTIQEQRHLKSFSTVSTTAGAASSSASSAAAAASKPDSNNNGHLSPPASTTSSSRAGGGGGGAASATSAQATASSELDRALIQLDNQLERISQSMVDAEKQVDLLLTTTSSSGDKDSQKDQPEHLRDIARTRRDSRASLSSLASFDDALLQTGASSATYAPALTPAQVQSRFQDIQAEWLAVTTDADMLKRELSEDKYLLVFRTVSDQADNMMSSLQKAITLSQDFIAVFRNSQAVQQQQSNSRLSLDGNDVSPEAQLEDLRSLKKTFNVKTSYYGPACEQVFHVLERGIKDKATSNGTILHRYADLKMRWKSIRDAILRTDRDMTKIERHLCKTLGLEVPAYSQEVIQQYGNGGEGATSSSSRQRQHSAAAQGATSTPPRLQPKSSARTLRHMSSSQSGGADSSFSAASTSSPSTLSRSSRLPPQSPPAPAKPPRSELRRLSSAQRLGGSSAQSPSSYGNGGSSSINGGTVSGAIPIPNARGDRQQAGPSSSSSSYRGPGASAQMSSSMGATVSRSGMPHRRSISASANEPMADPAYRRASVLLSSSSGPGAGAGAGSGSGSGSGAYPHERPAIPPRAGSRTGARTPLSSSGGSSNPFKHTGSEYSYAALNAGRAGAAGPSPRRAHSPTHPPSSYRLPGGPAGAGAGPVAPRRSKTPQPSSYGYTSGGSGSGSTNGYGYGGASFSSAASASGRIQRGGSEPPELSGRPASRTSVGRGPTGTVRSSAMAGVRGSRPPVSGSRGAGVPSSASLGSGSSGGGGGMAAFDDAMEDLSMESGSMYDDPPSPIGVRQRPASSMAGYFPTSSYHPPAAHGQYAPDTHIPRLAVGATNSPAASLASLPGRPGSSLSQASTSTSTTGWRAAGRNASVGGGGGGGYQGASRLTMQTPEPALAAQVKRLSLFARPSQHQHHQQQANAAQYGLQGASGSGVRKSSRPPPARLNHVSASGSASSSVGGRGVGAGGRTTPLSAAALAAVPQGNPALAWMRDASGTASPSRGGGGGGAGTSPSHSFNNGTGGGLSTSSSVAAFRAQRASVSGAGAGGAGGSAARAETPLSESSFGGQSVGGWGVRPGAVRGSAASRSGYHRSGTATAGTGAAAHGVMSSATGGVGGGAGSFDVYVPNARDALDVAVAEVVNALGVAIERVDEPLPRGVRTEVAPGKDLQARYAIAGKTVQCKLLMLHRPAGAAGHRAGTNVKKLLVRVGGGWQDFEGWISASILGHLDY